MLRRTSLLALVALTGCTDLNFDTACSNDQCVDSTAEETLFAETSVDAPEDTELDSAIDSTLEDTPLDSDDSEVAADTSKPDSAVDSPPDASLCTALAYSCVGAALRQCNPTGTAYTPIATCATPELCLGSTGGICKTAVCAVGEKRCGAKNVEICNVGRAGWDTSTSCSISCSSLTCLDVVELAGGRGGASNRFCGRLSDKTARCWGQGTLEVTGTSDTTPHTKPAIVVGVTNAVQLSVGESTSAALLGDGTVKLWGGLPDYSYAGPTTLAAISGATSISLGAYYGCAIVSGGNVKCWGANGAGQLGDGTTTGRTAPPWASPSVTASKIFAASEATFSLSGTDSFGWGAHGEFLGVGVTTTPVKSPTSSLKSVSAIQGGVNHMCFLLTDKTVSCAGFNASGQLGNGTTSDSSTAVKVAGLSSVVGLAVGGDFSCALSSAGTVSCWGSNYAEQLASTTLSFSASPVLVSGITTAIAIAATSSTACALLSDKSIKCWGDNSHGELGAGLDGTTVPSKSAPTTVTF